MSQYIYIAYNILFNFLAAVTFYEDFICFISAILFHYFSLGREGHAPLADSWADNSAPRK